MRLVWGEEPPRTADKTLQSYVNRLRKGLGPDSIVRIGVAYRLDVTAASVDVVRFQRLLGLDDTEAALAEWTGTPLAGLDADGLTATVDGLVEQYLGVVETDLGRRIEADAHAVIGSLTELTATYPFREGLWALLMTALYRVGRQQTRSPPIAGPASVCRGTRGRARPTAPRAGVIDPWPGRPARRQPVVDGHGARRPVRDGDVRVLRCGGLDRVVGGTPPRDVRRDGPP